MDVPVGIGLALVTAVTWGSREILLRKAFQKTRLATGLLVTMLSSFVISLTASVLFESRYWNEMTVAVVFLWLITGLLHFPIAMTLYYKGIESVGGSRTSVLSNSSALVTPILGMTLLSEPSAAHIIVGVFATGIGIVIVSSSAPTNSSGWHWERGMIFGLVSGCFWSITNLLTRFGLTLIALPMTGLTIAVGLALLPTIILLTKSQQGARLSDLKDGKLVLGSFLSGLGQVTLFGALAFAATVFVVPTYNLKSIVTVLLAYVLIPKSEKLNWKVLIGALMAIAGIVLINV
jgi:drug/metabolite transporter (DMT)-like permease